MTIVQNNYFLLNGQTLESSKYRPELVYDQSSIYEVIRVIKGIPVFLEDHLNRLYGTARLRQLHIWFEKSQIEMELFELIKKNQQDFGNIKIVVSFGSGGNTNGNHRILSFIDHHYPDEEQYKNGVETILFRAERTQPAAKVINHKLRSAIFRMLIDCGAYEALLVDRNGYITEGSRSNVFFISGESVVTAPDGDVLSGIARKYVKTICKSQGLLLKFEKVDASEIVKYDSGFLTGTSPKVLPISQIGNIKMDVHHPLLKTLSVAYDKYIDDYVRAQIKD